MPTTIKLDSKIFDKGVRRAAISSGIGKSAKVFKEATRRRQIEGKPSGKVYPKKKGGKGFGRAHRASRKGQRPAPDTGTLANATVDIKTGEFSVSVEIANKVNPENGANAKDYAERLQGKMQRKIMTSEDAKVAQAEMNYRMNKVISDLT
jgi:hypothetical protein